MNNSFVGGSQANATVAISPENGQDNSEKEIRNENTEGNFTIACFLPKMPQLQSTILRRTMYNTTQWSQLEEMLLLMLLVRSLNKIPISTQDPKNLYRWGLVIVHSFSPLGETGNAVVDIYRVNDNGKIAEHWDVIQQIPSNPANNNTMFYFR
jgi:hypothetical protein